MLGIRSYRRLSCTSMSDQALSQPTFSRTRPLYAVIRYRTRPTTTTIRTISMEDPLMLSGVVPLLRRLTICVPIRGVKRGACPVCRKSLPVELKYPPQELGFDTFQLGPVH